MEKPGKTAADFWNERYSSYVTVYGNEPNEFFKECMEKIPTGKLRLPGEGEETPYLPRKVAGWLTPLTTAPRRD